MKYVGMYTQQVRNNGKSLLLLFLFPAIILSVVYAFLVVMEYLHAGGMPMRWEQVNYSLLAALPWVVTIVGGWFTVAYFLNTSMIRRATGARPLTRKENPRVYNIVENLTMTCGMPMPKVNVIDDPQLNAFASGIDEKSYTVTLTTGICDCLNDEELAGVVGHELTHIRNRDTRLLVVSIIFVGILSTAMSVLTRVVWRMSFYGTGAGSSRGGKKESGGAGIAVAIVVALVCSAIGYFFALLTRFAISRKREYMADAGGAELCGDPLALASALRKISGNPGLGNVERDDIAQLYIIHPKAVSSRLGSMVQGLFSTHPSVERRIAYLEQF